MAGRRRSEEGVVWLERMPSGRVVEWSHDDAGRPTGVLSGTRVYASGAVYADHGGMASLRLNGYGMRETTSFDPLRLQPLSMTVEKCTDNTMACSAPSPLLGLGYTYQTGPGNGPGPNNHGNPRTQDISVPGMTTARQQYGHL